MLGHGGVSPGPPSPSKRREQERAAIIHGTCRGRMPPTVPARTLLCGGADVLACKIRFSPEIEATRNGWCAWAPGRAALAVHYAVREEGAGSCAWGVMPSPLHAVRMTRFGHLVPFRTKSRPRPRCGSRRRQARARRAGRAVLCGLSAQVWAPAHGASCRRRSTRFE